ncbi:MAG: D-alanine--D-alanine ligase [Oscillospiraceae bacterium]|nr:D-alanine--D-alanine ligase [Oscillospiraceae bacterium]
MKTIAVLFGGKSTEHEVSVITGLQAFAALDRTKYYAIPVYISKDNEFYTGKALEQIENYADLPALIKKCRRVLFFRNGKAAGIHETYINTKTGSFRNGMKKPLATIDAALLCVHGTNVEDGALQGYLQMHGIPHTGCDVLSSAVGMDKAVQKAVLRQFADICVLDCVAFTAKQYITNKDAVLAQIADKIGAELPVIVKPVNLGSSIGIRIAKSAAELTQAIDHALMFADKIIVERAVANLKEINCAVIGGKDDARASECEEPVNAGDILDFNDKYRSDSGCKLNNKAGGSAKSAGMASLKRKIPAEIPPETREQVRTMAVRAFKALGCSGVARIDFLLDTKSGELFFNEINTIPGSLSFYLWEPLKISYPELLDEMLELALKRERERESLTYSFKSNILSAFKGGFGGSKS